MLTRDPDSFFYRDADIEQAELEAAGRAHHSRKSQALKLIALGRKDEAARVCPHGWSGAADQEQWSRGIKERRCYDCGTRFKTNNDSPFEPKVILVPCEFPV